MQNRKKTVVAFENENLKEGDLYFVFSLYNKDSSVEILESSSLDMLSRLRSITDKQTQMIETSIFSFKQTTNI